MLDTVYRDFRTGYVPRWHGDVIDPAGAYLTPARHTLLVAVAADGAEPFWRSLAKVVHDEREDAGGGQGIVHFEVPMAGWRGAR